MIALDGGGGKSLLGSKWPQIGARKRGARRPMPIAAAQVRHL